ncbi:MAG TPA: response regulator [Acetobacteraceae bacterium]|nr:response regulator [Acetobacteraceae bacterium]
MKAARVLVVDDDLMVGTLLSDTLAGMGHAVCAIETNERDAITAAMRCHPDLMIVDERLGQGSGMAAVDAILVAGPVPHVFVSGDVSVIRSRRPDAVVLQKPYRVAELAQAIARVLGPAPVA